MPTIKKSKYDPSRVKIRIKDNEKKFLSEEEYIKDYKKTLNIKNQKKNTIFVKRRKTPHFKNKKIIFINKLLNINLHLTLIFVPIFFLPLTASPLELNKLFIFSLLTGINLILYALKILFEKEIGLKELIPSIAVVIFFLTIAFSTIFSIYKENSLFGFSIGMGSSFFAYIFLFIFFFIVSNFIQDSRNIYYYLINIASTSLIVYTIAILEAFSIDLFSYIQIGGPGFNTIGTIYSLAIYAALMLVLSNVFLSEAMGGIFAKLLFYILAITSIFILILINYKILFLAIAGAMIFMIVSNFIKENDKKGYYIFPLITLIITVGFFFILKNKQIIPVVGFVNEFKPVIPNFNQSFKIFFEAIKEKHIFGSGLNNYSYFYAKYKTIDSPTSFNQGWSYVFTLFTEGGILVILGYIFMIALLSKIAFSNFIKKETPILAPISITWIFLTSLNFIVINSFSLHLLWWFFSALLVASSSKEHLFFIDKKNKKYEYVFRLSIIMGVVFISISFLYLMYTLTYKYIASYHYQKAIILASGELEENRVRAIGAEIQKAIKNNPKKDKYLISLSDVYWHLAQETINNQIESLNEVEKQKVGSWINKSLESSQASIAINDSSYLNYNKLASLYYSIIGLHDNAIDLAIKNYNESLRLNPKDSSTYIKIADIYLYKYNTILLASNSEEENLSAQAKENLEKAKEYLNKAIEINANNSIAKTMLSLVLEKTGNIDDSINIYQEIITNIDPSNHRLRLKIALLFFQKEEYARAIEELNEIIKLKENYADARYILALSYLKTNEKTKAIEQLEKVIELNPENDELKEMTDNLKKNQLKKLEEITEGLTDEVTELEEEVIEEEIESSNFNQNNQ